MALRFYYDLMSQPCRAVYIFLKLNNIPFEPKQIALRKGEHFSEAYKKINPVGLVPVVDDNGFIITESVTILKYLAAKHNVPDHWYPRNDLQAMVRVDEYLNWQHVNTRVHGSMIFQNLAILPRMMNKPVDWKKVESFRSRMTTSATTMEKYFLRNNNQFLGGNEISVADILGVCELMQLYACHEERFYESSPILNAWVERVKSKLNPYFDESNFMVYKMRENYARIAEEYSKL